MDDLFFEYEVNIQDSLDRIDRFLANKIEHLSRSTIKKLIAEEKVLVNQAPIKASYSLKVSDLIEIIDVVLGGHKLGNCLADLSF